MVNDLDDEEHDEEAPDPLADLSDRERAFVLAYVGVARQNATRAAQLAGYSGDRHTRKVTGCRVVKRSQVRTAINRLLDSEASTVQESLVRITRRARGSIADLFRRDENGKYHLDLDYASQTGALDAVKCLTLEHTTVETKFGTKVTDTVVIEMHDAMKADAFLLRYFGYLRPASVIEQSAKDATHSPSVVILPERTHSPEAPQSPV